MAFRREAFEILENSMNGSGPVLPDVVKTLNFGIVCSPGAAVFL